MLVDLSIIDFLDNLSDSTPAPGGGSVAALHGAIASALVCMVAELTIDKKGYESHEALMTHILHLASDRQIKFERYVERDFEAYSRVFDCFKLPKNTDEEKIARSAAIQDATKHAALVPMEVARFAYELMSLIADVARLGNRNTVTDACVAMMTARSAVLGALMNVRVNLKSLKDKAFAEALQTEADTLEAAACAREKELLDSVNQDLRV